MGYPLHGQDNDQQNCNLMQDTAGIHAGLSTEGLGHHIPIFACWQQAERIIAGSLPFNRQISRFWQFCFVEACNREHDDLVIRYFKI